MTDMRAKPTNGRDWRAHLTREERSELADLEKIIAKAEKMALMPRLLKAKIQNRATARAGKASK
jgi:hypothetical protein